MEMLNKKIFNEIETTNFKNNVRTLYNDDETSSKILQSLLAHSFDEKEFVKANERIFGILSGENREALIRELEDFRSEVLQIRESEELEAKLQNSLRFFKEQSDKSSQKWEEFKDKLNVQSSKENLELEDINLVRENLVKNKEEIKEMLKENKLLGEMGEITLNELVDKGINVVSPIADQAKKFIEDGSFFLAPVTLFFTFRGVVKLFDSIAYRDPPKNMDFKQILEYKKMRSRELMTFMVLGAPFIAGSLYTIQKLTLPTPARVRVETLPYTEGEGPGIDKGSVLTSIGLIGYIKNRTPNWLRYVFLIIFVYFSLTYFPDQIGDYNIRSILFNNLIYLKWFFALGSISSFFMVIYYSLNIYFYILYSRNVFKTPVYLPYFILEWLKKIENMSKYNDKGFYIEFYFRLILVYLLTFILAISIIYWLS